ncbi:MAG: PilZ domain-containing protein [Acidobacteriota bacterium]
MDRDERRDDPRAHPAGIATVTRLGREPADFAIRDLSGKGMRLVGATRLVEGELVSVAFDVDGLDVTLDAIVLRTEPQRSQSALEFRRVAPAVAAAIAHAIGKLRQRAGTAAAVLVCHDDAETRAALERDILRLGRIARACATLDEARTALADPAAELSAVLLASSLPGEPLRALVEQLAADHPQIRRVLLFGEQLGSLDHAISSRIDAVLRMPPRIRPLARALGIDMNDSSLALLLPRDPGEPRR